jgi:hypoxanthine phosphoribosyltransferase
VLAGITSQRPIVTHGCTDACNLVGRDGRAQAGAIDDDARIDFAASGEPSYLGGDVGIINRIGRVGADIIHRQPLGAQVTNQRGFERQAAVVAPNRHAPDVGRRWQHGKVRREHVAEHGDTTLIQRVSCQRRHVATDRQLHRSSWLDRTRVGFGDDVETLHTLKLLSRPAERGKKTQPMIPTLLPAEAIRNRITDLAREIRRDVPEEDIHLICVLKGAFLFLGDLIRAMDGRVTIDFMALSSYSGGTTSSGEVRLIKDLDYGLEGRNVVIVEDIVDTGLTLHYLQEILRARNPKSLRTACLLSKPSRRKIDVQVEYVGFTIEDRFVVGYGLDYSEQYRNLPYIGVLQ